MALKKTLTLSSTNKRFLGVCGGLGEYFNIDPIIFRILFIFAFFTGGSGLLLYLILAFIIPTDYQKVGRYQTRHRFDESNREDVTPEDEEDMWSDF